MSITWKTLGACLLLTGTLSLTNPVHAQGVNDLLLTFDNPIQTGSIGDTLTFSGTASYPVSNLFGAAPLPLNVDDLELDGNGLDLNDYFATNLPLALNPDQSVQVDFFSVTITPDAQPGSYVGTYNIETSDPFVPPLNFIVQVASPAVPEPSPLLLTVGGLLPVAWCVRKRVTQ